MEKARFLMKVRPAPKSSKSRLKSPRCASTPSDNIQEETSSSKYPFKPSNSSLPHIRRNRKIRCRMRITRKAQIYQDSRRTKAEYLMNNDWIVRSFRAPLAIRRS